MNNYSSFSILFILLIKFIVKVLSLRLRINALFMRLIFVHFIKQSESTKCY